ncbi:MAG: hypothetical protein Q9173_001240 [Seirophora scorigena]
MRQPIQRSSYEGMPMVKLAYEIAPSSTYLEYLGKGIEMRSFEAKRKRPRIETLAVYLSLSTTYHERDTNRQATFYDIFSMHNPHDATSFEFQGMNHAEGPRHSPSSMRLSPQVTSDIASDYSETVSASVSPTVFRDYGLSIERTERKLEDLQCQLHEVEQTTSQLKEQLRQTTSQLKGEIREKEQTASNLREDIHYGEMILGVVIGCCDESTGS